MLDNETKLVTENTAKEMSLPEKNVSLEILGKSPELPYPLKDLECSDGTVDKVYEIPEADKAAVFADLYPFADGLTIDDERLDLHEQKLFKVKDYLVIRWGGTNILASPYYPKTGGMFVDWLDPAANGDGIEETQLREPKEGDAGILCVQTFAPKVAVK